MNNIYSEFLTYINSIDPGNLLLYRNDEELAFLKDWISNKDKPIQIEKENDLQNDSLEEMVKGCIKCGNVENKKPGYGTGNNRMMIILNTPSGLSRVEVQRLKDQSTALLGRMLEAIKIDVKDCYITNLIKCDAGMSIGRPGLMLKNCEPILRREIAEYDPDPVILMGDDIPVKRIINEYSNKKWYRIEHPADLIKNPALKKSAWETLQIIEKFIKNPK